MQPTVNTRKPIDQLTSADIHAYPIWEFTIDEESKEEQDETWVRPIAVDEIPLGAYSLSIATDFLTPSGSKFEGIVDIFTNGAVTSNGGCLIHRGKYIYISKDRKSRERRNLLKMVHLTENEMFPLTYTLRVKITNESSLRSGAIH